MMNADPVRRPPGWLHPRHALVLVALPLAAPVSLAMVRHGVRSRVLHGY